MELNTRDTINMGEKKAKESSNGLMELHSKAIFIRTTYMAKALLSGETGVNTQEHGSST